GLGTSPGGNGLRLLPAELRLVGNSAYPRDWNDGALWAGRGMNAALTAGAAFRWGPLSAAVAPVASWQSNEDFDRRIIASPSRSEFGSFLSSGIDLPQRFGTGSFTRIDPGQSYARLDVRGFGAG